MHISKRTGRRGSGGEGSGGGKSNFCGGPFSIGRGEARENQKSNGRWIALGDFNPVIALVVTSGQLKR